MKHSSLFPLILGAVALAGCGADFDPGSRVSSFRVLAVQADQPFAAPGETVNLSALDYDPQSRTVTWAWATCVNPAESTVQGCFEKIDEDTRASGASPILAQGPDENTFALTIPSDALSSLPENVRRSAFVGVISIACPGNLSLETSSTGLPFRCLDATDNHELSLDQYAVGLKRVFVRSKDRNQNPSLARITFDHSDWAEGDVKDVVACDTDGNTYANCSGLSKHQLGAYVSDGSIESGTDEFGVSFSEQVIVDYYATEGIFENDVRIAQSPENGWAGRKQSAGKDITFWFVVHDDRGGVSWTTRQAHVE